MNKEKEKIKGRPIDSLEITASDCILCLKRKDFISRIFKFHTCSKCRDLIRAGVPSEAIRQANRIIV